MSAIILALSVAICVAAAGFAFVPAMFGSRRAEKRIKAMSGNLAASRAGAEAGRSREGRRKLVQDAIRLQSETLEKKKRTTLQQRLEQAGLKMRASAWLRNQIVIGVVACVVFFLMVEWYFALAFGVSAAFLLPRFYLNWRRKRHEKAYLDELPNAVEAIVRGVKAGLPLNDSMRHVAKEGKEPIKGEFARALDLQAAGRSTAESIQLLFDRMPLPEVNFLVVVIAVQQQSGGNLSEALTNLARVLRNRKRMKEKIKAMASEAKASAGIIGSLPFVVGTLVSIVSPTYLTPLFSTTIGWIWLGIAAVMMTFGIWIMSRMINFDF